MKKLIFILVIIFAGCGPSTNYKTVPENEYNAVVRERDSLREAIKSIPRYYETGWTLVKINGGLDAENEDSVECVNMNTTFGLYRMFDEGAGASLSYKIQDIELGGMCTSFGPGKKLYIISKTPF